MNLRGKGTFKSNFYKNQPGPIYFNFQSTESLKYLTFIC